MQNNEKTQKSLELIQRFLDATGMTIAKFDVQEYGPYDRTLKQEPVAFTRYSLRIGDEIVWVDCCSRYGHQWTENVAHTKGWNGWKYPYCVFLAEERMPALPDALRSALDAENERQLTRWPILRDVHYIASRFPDKIQKNWNEYILRINASDRVPEPGNVYEVNGHHGDILFYEISEARKILDSVYKIDWNQGQCNGLTRGLCNHNVDHLNQILYTYYSHQKDFLHMRANEKTK